MHPNEYLVARRTGHWQVIVEAATHGPFVSRQVAIDSATAMARNDFSDKKHAIVMLEENGQMVQLYNSCESTSQDYGH
jgi:hypothetical protein